MKFLFIFCEVGIFGGEQVQKTENTSEKTTKKLHIKEIKKKN